MKALLEVDITGDFLEPLGNDDVIDILDSVIVDGADSVHLEAKYKIIKMIHKEESEKYFLEHRNNGDIELYEEDGDFYNHDTQDLLIATFRSQEKAELVMELLNKGEDY